MPPSVPALVEPAVLRWARESIGLSALAAARKIGVPDGRVEEWEAGTASPTIPQLRNAARVYKRALSVFFLSQPPNDFDTLRDFRRLPDAASTAWSPELHGEYRRAHAQRESALELAEIEDVELAARWRLTAIPADNEALGAAARELLLATAPVPLPAGARAPAHAHLNVWVAALEEAGVLVLATERGTVSRAEMRAFSLYFDVLPVIMVNGADFARGRTFSLLHEYAHLLLHTDGLCDTTTDARPTTPNRQLEARCNAIAASALMPRAAVLANEEVRSRADSPTSWDYAALEAAAAPFGVSAEALLRRLVTLGRTTRGFYEQRREEFLVAYEEREADERPSGGDWYRNTARDRGKWFIRRVADAHARRVIDSYTAASLLDVKVSQLPRLAEYAALPSSA